MNKNETILNYIKLASPTKRQAKEVLDILAREFLHISDDDYFINSLTGKKGKKVEVATVEDTKSDDDIILDFIYEHKDLLEAKIKGYIDGQIDDLRLKAKAYVDNEITKAKKEMKEYVDSKL